MTTNKETDVKANGITYNISETLQGLPSSIERFSQFTGQDIEEFIENASQKNLSYTKRTRNYVEKNPIRSIAVASVASLALGSILTFAFSFKKKNCEQQKP